MPGTRDVARNRYPRAFWVLWAAAVFGWAGRLVLPFLTLYLTQELAFSAKRAGTVLALYGFGGMGAALCAGWLADRFGPKRVLVCSASCSGTTAFLIGVLPHNRVSVLALVLALGAASQTMPPAFYNLVANLGDPSRLANSYSWVMMGLNTGFAATSVLAGMLARVSFSLLFVAEAVVVWSAALLVALFVPGDVSRSQGRRRTAGSPRRPATGGLRRLLADRVFMSFLLLNGVFMAVYMQNQVSLPIAMAQQGYDSFHYGLLLGLNGIALVIVQIHGYRLVERRSLPRALAIGMFGLAVGVGAEAFATSMAAYAVCVLLWTAGELVYFPSERAVSVQLAPGELRGLYLGAVAMTTGLALLVAPALGGWILGSMGTRWLWLSAGLVALLGAVARWALVPVVSARIRELSRGRADAVPLTRPERVAGESV